MAERILHLQRKVERSKEGVRVRDGNEESAIDDADGLRSRIGSVGLAALGREDVVCGKT